MISVTIDDISFKYDTGDKNILLIFDWASLGYQTLFGLKANIKKKERGEMVYDEDPDLEVDLNDPESTIKAFKNSMLSRVTEHIRLFNPHKVIIALEGGSGNWRFDLYREYKANRKFSEWPFVITKREFDNARNELAEEVSSIYGSHAIGVPRSEGDDVIAVSVLRLKDLYDEIIVSSGDRDIVQLEKYDNVKVFDSKDNSFKSCEEGAKFFLDTKILQGDKSDNIFGILLPGKKRRLGPKTAATLYNSCGGNIYDKAEEEGWLDQYILNKSLIDMEQIPSDIVESITEAIHESHSEAGDYMQLISSGFTKMNIEKISIMKTRNINLFESQNNSGGLL